MAIISYTNAEQDSKELYGGNINIKKPIGFPEDDGLLKSYSTLYYWAHIRSDKGGEIDEQFYKGFLILTFVLNGEVEYHDSKYIGWKKIVEGDMQIAGSGSGFTRSERILPDSSLFQIWVDPNFEISLNQPATSEYFAAECLPVSVSVKMTEKTYIGEHSPAEVPVAGLTVREIMLKKGPHIYSSGNDLFISGFILEGEVKIKNNMLRPMDFFIAKEEPDFQIEALSDCRIFVVESPVDPGYSTYAGKFVM